VFLGHRTFKSTEKTRKSSLSGCSGGEEKGENAPAFWGLAGGHSWSALLQKRNRIQSSGFWGEYQGK